MNKYTCIFTIQFNVKASNPTNAEKLAKKVINSIKKERSSPSNPIIVGNYFVVQLNPKGVKHG